MQRTVSGKKYMRLRTEEVEDNQRSEKKRKGK
jgi:hypothetical protein